MSMRYEKWTKEMPWPIPPVPLGVYLYADHAAVCGFTSNVSVGVVIAALPGGPWTPAIAAAIIVSSQVIRAANQDSGGKGLRLRYNFCLGVIDDVKRRGRGSSPCPQILELVDAPAEPLGANDPRPLAYTFPDQDLLEKVLTLPEPAGEDLY
jgi:hypothetical protein